MITPDLPHVLRHSALECRAGAVGARACRNRLSVGPSCQLGVLSRHFVAWTRRAADLKGTEERELTAARWSGTAGAASGSSRGSVAAIGERREKDRVP
jgi:hypothetical protein